MNSTNVDLQDLLFNSVDALIAYIDVNEVYQCVNNTYALWRGLDPAYIVGSTIREIVGDRAYETIHPRFLIACSGAPATYETDLFDARKRKYCQGSYTPHFGDNGDVKGVFVVVTDITHRCDAEAALRQSEERFQSAFDYAIIGMALMSPQGRWLQVNRSLCQMLGYTEAEMLGLSVWDITHLDQHSEAQVSIREILSKAKQIVQVERRYLHKSGGFVDVQLSGSLVHGSDGSPLHFVLQVQDISLRKIDERLKKEFVSTVSHELRTPLTSISGSLGLIIGGAAGALPDRAARLLKIAESNCARLVRLVNDILDIEKIESGMAPFEKVPVDLRATASRVIDTLRGYSASYDVDIRLVHGASPEVLGDEDRLVQVLTNILSNAAKFSPPGSVVEISLSSGCDKVCVSVHDNGPGIPVEFSARIFSKFAQADASDTRQRGGTGLGLAIAREIVAQHSGRIWFDSIPGQGATFHIELPQYVRPGSVSSNRTGR